nr:hypothetical protein [Tanacetum cinerariifolium]
MALLGLILCGGRTSYSGYPDRPSFLPHQNPPPSGTSSGPGYVNQVPPSYRSSGYPAGTGYNSGGYASAVAAAAQEYPGQNSCRPLMNRLPPIQGGYADSRNYGLSSGYPTQPNMPPTGQRGPHGGMYQGGVIFRTMLHGGYFVYWKAGLVVVVYALLAVISIVDTDPSHRNLFIRGIGWDTTTTTLKSVFEQYGEVEEGLVIVDKATNKSKGYMVLLRLSFNLGICLGKFGVRGCWSVLPRLGRLRKSRWGLCMVCFFVYKSDEGARKAVVDSVKSIDGYQVMCKMAVDGKKGRAGGGMVPSRGPVPGIVNTAPRVRMGFTAAARVAFGFKISTKVCGCF